MGKRKRYSDLRSYLNVASGLLGLFLTIATPMVLVAVYRRFKNKLKNTGTNRVFFVWATILVSSVAAVLMFIENILTYKANISIYPDDEEEQGFHDIYVYFKEMLGILITMAICDFVFQILGIIYMYKTKQLEDDFPIPGLMKCILLFECYNHNSNGDDPQATAGTTGIDPSPTNPPLPGDDPRATADPPPTNPPLPGDDPQAIVGHAGAPPSSNDIIPAPLATPPSPTNTVISSTSSTSTSTTGSSSSTTTNPINSVSSYKTIVRLAILLFGCYFSTLFLQLSTFHMPYIILGSIASPIETLSLTSFYIASYFTLIAFVAFFLKITDGLNNSNEKPFRRYFFMCILPLLSALVFIACAVFFMMFFVTYTLMIQGYRNNNGAIGILGSILPSLFVTAVGIGGTRLIKCIGGKKEKNKKKNKKNKQSSKKKKKVIGTC